MQYVNWHLFRKTSGKRNTVSWMFKSQKPARFFILPSNSFQQLSAWKQLSIKFLFGLWLSFARAPQPFHYRLCSVMCLPRNVNCSSAVAQLIDIMSNSQISIWNLQSACKAPSLKQIIYTAINSPVDRLYSKAWFRLLCIYKLNC